MFQFVQKYLAYRIPLEYNSRTLGGRIRLVAERVCEDTGNAGAEEMRSCIHDLCGLYLTQAFSGIDNFDLDDIFTGRLGEEITEERLHEDTINAALYLGIPSIVKKRLLRLSDSCEYLSHEYWTYWGRHWIPAYRGDFDMLKLLLSIDQPTPGDVHEPIPKHCYLDMIKWSALGGHSEIFNFALSQAMIQDYEFDMSHRHSSFDYEDVAGAMLDTAFPSDYERLAAIVGRCHMVFQPRYHGDIHARLCRSARNGRVDMVQHFLEKGAWLNDPRAKRDYVKNSVEGKRQWCNRRMIPKITTPLLTTLVRMPKGVEAVVKLLLERGADPNWYCPDRTPLMAATFKNRIDLVRLLINHGADVNDGSPPPIVLAIRQENTELFKYLRGNGARLDTPETGAWGMSEARRLKLDSMEVLLIQEGIDASTFFDRVPCFKEYSSWESRNGDSDQELSDRYSI
ncbi:hypothetical protein VTL71DRAFT_9794 [Oculimacula yallundae]|uniref:Ankyrin n=1 Tax=Oculimacula yallundae TaxID=86028 RepID=A0ABR4BRC8_9HELO